MIVLSGSPRSPLQPDIQPPMLVSKRTFLSLALPSSTKGCSMIVDCKDASMPQYTWTSFLQVGFLSSLKALMRLLLGAMKITSSCLTISVLMMLPPNSTSSPMHSFDGFSLRFLSSQKLISLTFFLLYFLQIWSE